MFKFIPCVSVETIKQHVEELRATRITRTTALEMRREAPVAGEEALREEADYIWPAFEEDVSKGLDFIKDTHFFNDQQKADIELALKGIISCAITQFDASKALSMLNSLAKEIDGKGNSAEPFVQFFNYCIAVAPLYWYAMINVMSYNDILFLKDMHGNPSRDLAVPKNGILVTYCAALYPNRETINYYNWCAALNRTFQYLDPSVLNQLAN